jgi:hypothetical protein
MLPLTEELIAWAEVHAPGVNVRVVRDIWLQDCHAKGYRFRDWEGELKTQLLKAYHKAEERASRPARWSPPGRDLAREPVVDPSPAPAPDPTAEPPEWTYTNGPYGLHRDCGEYHQFLVPCRTKPTAPTPLTTDTGPPAGMSDFSQRHVVRRAEEGVEGVGALLAATVHAHGNGHGPPHDSEGRR